MSRNKKAAPAVAPAVAPAAPVYSHTLYRSAGQRPKKQYTPSTVVLNGNTLPTCVTGKVGGKWPQYTFVWVGGVHYYLQGALPTGTVVTCAMPAQRHAPAAQAAPPPAL